jgi:hypothetical protein
MGGRELVESIAKKRTEIVKKEVESCFPGALAQYDMLEDGRAHISVFWEKTLINEEYVETAESWNQPERMKEYRKALSGKARLVVLVPERHSRSARLKLLDLNHWWLFNYLLFSYDHEGNMKKVGRPMYCFPDQGYA